MAGTHRTAESHKDSAVRAIQSMHKAIASGDYKRARRHKIVADKEIDKIDTPSKTTD